MKSFNWRCLSENTLRSYTQAARDFETVTGRWADQADAETIAVWRASMAGRKLSNSTIRQRLSAIAVIAGIRVDLPKRETSGQYPVTSLLSVEQVGKIMSVVSDLDDRILLVKLLTLGSYARTVMDRSAPFSAHFAGTGERELSAQTITRKIKQYARKAGLDEEQVSLRVWCLTGRMLIFSLKPDELVSVLDHHPELPAGVQWKRLHGIGRRSTVKV